MAAELRLLEVGTLELRDTVLMLIIKYEIFVI